MHVRCVGSGATTVLLVAGFGGAGDTWGAIEPAISQRARVCSSARFGLGASDPPPSTQTFATQATDLHTLMATIGEHAPYVVVGHSFGGAAAIMFASLFPDEVSGLALIDASPITWPAAMCDVPDDGTAAAATLRGICASNADPSANPEHLDVTAAFGDVAEIASVGSIPMVVITAVDRELPEGLAASELARLTGVWDDGQQHWLGLSTDARLVSVADTRHHIELDQPAVVIDEITRLIS
jgi:pimeloyl-ACP methyl ester carboxylesterase